MDIEYRMKLASLVERLYEKTRENTIKWQESHELLATSAYEAELGKFRVIVADYAGDILVRVLDRSGKVVENITDPMLSEVSVPSFLHSGWYAYMKDLLKMIERKVNGSEEAIDEIMSMLKNNE